MREQNLLERVKSMYLNKEYEVKDDNTLFIIKNVEYTINEDFLREVYR